MARFPDQSAFGASAPMNAENMDAPNQAAAQAPNTNALEIAKADSQYLVQTKALRDALAGEGEPDSLREKYEPLFRQAFDGGAALISDPQQRELWAQSRSPDFEGHLSATSDRAFNLTREREITGVATQLDAMRDLAAQTTDPAKRSEFIQSANGLIFGLQTAGYIDEAAAKEKQKAWAQDFALAAFSKLPAAEQVKWLEGDAREPDTGKGELIDFVPAAARESLLQTAQLNLRKETLAAQSAAALEQHNLKAQINDDLTAVLSEGKGIDSLALEKVQTILGPDVTRDWQETRADFATIRSNTDDLYALTDTELLERLYSVRPTGDMRDDPRKGAVFVAVREVIDDLRRLRIADPAKSVDDDPAVRAALLAVQQQPVNPQAESDLYDARLAAQTRAGIAHDAQSPITREEALPLIAPLKGIEAGQESVTLARVAETFEAQFGADADRALDFALRIQSETEQTGKPYAAGPLSGGPLLTRTVSVNGQDIRISTDPVNRWNEIISLVEASDDDAATDTVHLAAIRGRRPPRKPGGEEGEPPPPRWPLPDFLIPPRRKPNQEAEPSSSPIAERDNWLITGPEAEDLKDKIAATAPPEDIKAHPVMRDAIAKRRAVPDTVTDADIDNDAFASARALEFKGERVIGYDAAASKLVDFARSYSKDGPTRNEGFATIVIGQPAAGKSGFSEHIASKRFAAIVDIDDARQLMPEYQGGIGGWAVHRESVELAERVIEKLIANRTNMVIPKIGSDVAQIEELIRNLSANGYSVDLLHVDVPWQEAFRRNALRYLKTGRLVPPELFEKVSSKTRETYDILEKQDILHDKAEIYNGGPVGTDRVTRGDGELARLLRVRKK